MSGHPWARNEDGFWCEACGDLIARPDTDEDDLPDTCRQCGFPDFEEGTVYFEDEEDDHL